MKKKVIVSLAVALAVITLSACDSKLCYCYDHTASGVMESEVYVNSDTPCNTMNRGDKACVESHERMNPNEIAYLPNPGTKE